MLRRAGLPVLLAGSRYKWTERLGGPTTSWMAGWMMLAASVVTLSATVLAHQITLPQPWSGFQVVGDGAGPYDFAVDAGMALNPAWPRRDVYDATEPYRWYLQWGAFVVIGAIAAAGPGYHLLRQRHRTGVLPEHALRPAAAMAGGA